MERRNEERGPPAPLEALTGPTAVTARLVPGLWCRGMGIISTHSKGNARRVSSIASRSPATTPIECAEYARAYARCFG